MQYEDYARVFGALADPNRVEIVDMLRDGTMCACKILEKFHFTQPTLSYHMKYLVDSGLVTVNKVGVWNKYSLNKEALECAVKFLQK